MTAKTRGGGGMTTNVGGGEGVKKPAFSQLVTLYNFKKWGAEACGVLCY